MARSFFGIEKLIRLFKSNSDTEYVDILFGSAAPGGDGDEQDAAALGSLYIRQNGSSSTIYQKIGSSNITSDWKENGSSAAVIGTWRPEKVSVVTNDTLAVGSGNDLTALADNESGIGGNDVAVGEYIIADADGTPVLYEITAITSNTDITLAAATEVLANNNTFVTTYYLPDSPGGQEGKAIVNYNGSVIIKLADIDWNFADGINMAAGYASQNGSISSADTVNSAIEKLDGNQQDIQSASGLAQGDTNYGSFTSPASLLLAAAQTSKQLFQRIGVLLAQLRGVQVTGLTTLAAVDAVPHASVKTVKWLVEAYEDATPANMKAFEVFAMTDGTSVEETVYAKLKLGSNFNLILGVAINGANMELQASSSTAGVTITARRIEVVKSVL